MMNRGIISFICALALVSCASESDQSITLQSEADIAGMKVATISGSSYDIDLSGRNDINLQRYNSPSEALQALISEMTDVVVYDEVVYNSTIRKENGVKIALLGERGSPTAFMFPKESAELAQACSAVQRRMNEDGSMQKLKDFWLTDRYAEVGTFTHIPNDGTGKPLRVITAGSTAPISFQVGTDWFGIEIDILRELGKELNRPLEIKSFDPASGLLAIKTGMADVLCGCVFITPERQQEFLFSEPYHDYHAAYFVKDRSFKPENQGLISWLKNSINKNLITEGRWRFITEGIWETVRISFFAILFGTILGMGLYLMTISRRRWVRSCAKTYKSFMAGIPQLVLLLILFYLVFGKSGVPSYMVAAITFSLFFASGVCDIYNTSLNAVPRGQTEAGLALGFTRAQTFFHIVFPQALRRGLPLYQGQCVSILKGTSIVGYIAIHDITKAGDLIRSRTFDAFLPLLIVTVLYFLLTWLIIGLLKLATPKTKVL